MRGIWTVVCAIAVAACNDGVVLEIRTDPKVPTKEVELFLGLSKCEDCTGIQPQDVTSLLPGAVYFRDGDPSFTAPVDDDGSAWFRIVPSEVGSRLGTVAAVSTDGDAAAITFDLDVSTGDHWVMQLERASSPLNASNDDGEFVQIWQQAAEPNASCIAFESWKDHQLGSRTFIVPKDDPDCDDFTPDNGECAAFAWGSSEPPTLAEVSCVVYDESDPALRFCALGGPACHDGQGRVAGSCDVSSYCIPSRLCTACAPAKDPTALRQCFASAVNSTLTAPRMTCLLPVQPDPSDPGGTGVLQPCPGSDSFPFGDLEPKILQCDTLEFSVGPSAVNGLGPFADRVKLKTGSFTGTSEEAELKVRSRTGGCTFDLELSGQIANNGTTMVAAPVALVSVTPTVAPGAVPKHLVMPLSVTFVKGCSSQPSCTVNFGSDDELLNCAMGRPPQPRTLTFGERPSATNTMVTTDTFIDSTAQTAGHGNLDSLQLVSSTRETVGLLSFDLSALPATAQVIAATLHLGSFTTVSNGPVEIYQMLESWNKDANWLTPGLGGQYWKGPAASPPSRVSTTAATYGSFAHGDNAITLPPSLIQAWISDPTLNFGVALVSQNGNLLLVPSMENLQALNLRPMLSVTIAP